MAVKRVCDRSGALIEGMGAGLSGQPALVVSCPWLPELDGARFADLCDAERLQVAKYLAVIFRKSGSKDYGRVLSTALADDGSPLVPGDEAQVPLPVERVPNLEVRGTDGSALLEPMGAAPTESSVGTAAAVDASLWASLGLPSRATNGTVLAGPTGGFYLRLRHDWFGPFESKSAALDRATEDMAEQLKSGGRRKPSDDATGPGAA